LTSIALVNIRWEKGESLRLFMERFGKVDLNIWNLSLDMAMYHMVKALWSGSFSSSLSKKLAENLDELRQRAAKYVEMEELREFRNPTRVKATNKVILNELKKRLGTAKGRWTEELVEVLWAYRCTPQTLTKETPYILTYGTEAIIPIEVGETSLSRKIFDLSLNQECMSVELDLINKL